MTQTDAQIVRPYWARDAVTPRTHVMDAITFDEDRRTDRASLLGT